MPVTVTGTLQTILGGDTEAGTVEVALCGYGPQVPRMNAATLGARVTDGTPDGTKSIDVDPGTGNFTFYCTGNDLIQPPNTYYTVTIRDSNGDIVQVNAYQFLESIGSYNLNEIQPFDPSQTPPAQLPYLVLDLLLLVPYASNADFPGDEYTAWETTLTGDCSPVFSNLVDGNLYTIIIVQDATGGHAFTWPSNVHNATWVNPDPNSITIQTFVAFEGQLYAIAAGTYYP